MTAKKKKVLFVIGCVVVVIVLAAAVFVLTFDINSYRPRIETAASAATGLEVRIKGKIGLSFFPFGIWANDINVASKGSEIISLENLKLGVELMPLLRKQLKVTRCEIVKPAVTIVKDTDGKYNFESIKMKLTEGKPGAVFSLNGFKLSKGVLVYLDNKTGEKTEFKDFNLAVKNVSIAGDVMKSASFTGNIDCREISKRNLKIANVKSPVKAENGVIHLMPLTMDIFGAKAEGDAAADQSEADAVYKINLKVSKLDFEKLEASFGLKKVIGGMGDLSVSLTVKEKRRRSLMSGMDGTFSLRGDNLVVYTMDLDKVLSSFETSQEFSLVDLGAFLIAGPLSTFAVRGYRFGDVYNKTRGGRGAITQFISHWKIKGGAADATDCALATRHYRVALKGKLNLAAERYDDVIVALLDDKGCAKFQQSVSGPFASPRIGAVSSMESIAGPISKLYRSAKRFVQGGKCEVFYSGSVQQPPK